MLFFSKKKKMEEAMATFLTLSGFKPYTPTVRKGRAINPLSRQPGVYCATVIESGVTYVGSSGDLASRVSTNVSKLKQNIHHNRQFQSAYNDDPVLEVLVCAVATKTEAIALEKKLVAEMKSLDFLSNKGITENLGSRRTEQHKQIISQTHLGKIDTSETKELRSVVKRAFYKSDRGQELSKSISIPVRINGVDYSSIIGASRILKVSTRTIVKRNENK